MSSVTSSYEDTLRTLRTGKAESSPLTSFKRYISWGGGNADVLPYSSTSGKVSSPVAESSVLSWPPWMSSSQPVPWYDTFGLSTMQRYSAFGICIMGAVLLFLLAFMHLPLVILRPGKFVVPYCLGNMMLFVSFGFLHGFYSYCGHLFSTSRWPFTTAFLGTTLATLYVAMIMRMYALTIPLAIIQFLAMGAYVVSYIPGGSGGLSMFGSFATSSIRTRISGF